MLRFDDDSQKDKNIQGKQLVNNNTVSEVLRNCDNSNYYDGNSTIEQPLNNVGPPAVLHQDNKTSVLPQSSTSDLCVSPCNSNSHGISSPFKRHFYYSNIKNEKT